MTWADKASEYIWNWSLIQFYKAAPDEKWDRIAAEIMLLDIEIWLLPCLNPLLASLIDH